MSGKKMFCPCSNITCFTFYISICDIINDSHSYIYTHTYI
jgi:hypothetical protein